MTKPLGLSVVINKQDYYGYGCSQAIHELKYYKQDITQIVHESIVTHVFIKCKFTLLRYDYNFSRTIRGALSL